jgi:MFS family permease
MRAGTWLHIVLLYLCGLCAAASLGVLGPIAADLSRHFGVTPQDVGIAIGGQLLPLALAGFGIGWLVDRWGTTIMLRLSLVVLVGTALVSHWVPGFLGLRFTLLLQGAGFVAMIMTGQVILMLCLTGQRFVQAMSLWATAPPMGYGVGLLLVSGFAGTPAWRDVFLLHAALGGLLLLASYWMPAVRPTVRAAEAPQGPPSAAGVLRNPRVLRLGAAMALINLTGLGTNAILPLFLEQRLQMAPTLGARLLALASLASVIGSIVIGALLNRGWGAMRIAVLLGMLAMAGAAATFTPGLPASVVAAGLVVMQLTGGGGLALCFSVLPRLLNHPGESGVAAGLSAQIGGFGAALSAPVFFALLAMDTPWILAAAVVCGWLAVLWAIPVRRMVSAA